MRVLQLVLLSMVEIMSAAETCLPSSASFSCSCSTMVNGTLLEDAVIGDQGKARSFTRPLEDESEKILFSHNFYRKQKPYADMLLMSWNQDLALKATEISEKCSAGHSSTEERKNMAGFEYVGENIFISTEEARPTLEDIFSEWMADGDTPADGVATYGKQFTNAGQILNAMTSQVGCSMTKCEKVEHTNAETGWVMVCLYDIGANIDGQKYWEEGSACSKCPQSKSQCVGNLCSEPIEVAPEECTPFNVQFNCQCDNSDLLPSGRPASSSPGVLTKSTPFNDDELEMMTKLHNSERSTVQATRMDCMTWLPELATEAQSYSDQCNSEHSSMEFRTENAGFHYTGENVFVMTGAEKPTPEQVFEQWKASGKAIFDFETGMCNDDSCQSFAQIVWAGSQEVGCGMSQCSNIQYQGQAGWVVVCRYGPGGVYLGVPAFNPGNPCTACGTAKSKCYTNTCCEMSLRSVSTTSRSDNTKKSMREACHGLRDDKGYCTRAESNKRFADFMAKRCPGTC